MTVRILQGDCLDLLRTLPDESVHCCVTSPPYYGLRDYDVPPTRWTAAEFKLHECMPAVTVEAMECCLGHEASPLDFIGHCVLVFREVRRVLRGDGTLWLNTGDSYAGGGNGGGGSFAKDGIRSALPGTDKNKAMRIGADGEAA